MEEFDETYAGTRLGSVRKKKEKKKDWLVRLSTAQLVLAIIGVALLLAVSEVSPNTFESLKEKFEHIMQVDMGVGEVVDTLKRSIERLPSAASSSERQEITAEVEKTTEEISAQGGEDGTAQNTCFAPICSTVIMVMPVKGEITSRFGYRVHPITKKYGIHNGIDLAADEGTPIAAAFNGKVEKIGSNSVRGNYIVLSHGKNTKTYYLHCSEISAEEGAVIRAGEIIAKVGQT
ncbi:MAG TPA: hypothetical protein DDY98_06010, partial [Ruminococcaceae bacterium]|nr:hypothetical protein [Oscillospiraceae bacterium]